MAEKIVDWMIYLYCVIACYGAFRTGNIQDVVAILGFACMIKFINELEVCDE